MTSKTIKLLLVDDDDEFRDTCARWMRLKGYDFDEAGCGADAISKLKRSRFDVAVLDINMPGMSGLEVLQRIHDEELDVEVLMLTGEHNISSAVTAMKLGACDFISKPCSLSDLEHHISLAFERGRMHRENAQLKAVISRSQRKPELIGKSAAINETLRMIEKVAPTNSPVLIQGESGTGKEVVARMIQRSSPLHGKPFVTINCAALPEHLVESELFGHQKGAFTGATAEKPGLFEIADGGTLFIDEIGELPIALQPKLLRVLEDGSLRRVGSHQERRVEVRLITATNRDLSREVAKGNFREDLYYRINVLSIDLPPLREREGDVDCLIDHFLQPPWILDPSARKAMNRYSWPGNIRQLINVLQRATVLAEHDEITLDDLPNDFDDRDYVTPFDAVDELFGKQIIGDPKVSLDELTRAHVLEVLAKEDGNKAATARKLGIHRRKLYRLLDRYSSEMRRFRLQGIASPQD